MPRILLTNDDGIAAKSIQELARTLSTVGECMVVAPSGQRSASAHAISIAHAIEVSEYRMNDFHGYQVKGTPVDCVKLALSTLCDSPPDIIVSGINAGPNTGISVYYSGTVAAAREGAIAGIPSLAVSLSSFTYEEYSFSCTFMKSLVEKVLRCGLPRGTMLNVNIPAIPEHEIKGVRVTKQAQSRFVEEYVHRGVRDGVTLYELTGELEVEDMDPLNDEHAVRDGFVSITPLHLDSTDIHNLAYVSQLITEKGSR